MATSGDKTVNKVALCSAIFAGFAYVGYSVVRTAFCRKLGAKRDTEGTFHEEHRLYFRRLSQTTQTDVLLGDLDTSSSGSLVLLRPLTVQERIRELNLRARLFADTVMAIQTGGSRPVAPAGARSLQASPWSSPRILSPVDVRQLLCSRSSENLSADVFGSPGTPRRRWPRRSLRRASSRSPSGGGQEERERARREAERLLGDKEHELRSRLDALTNRDRALTKHEAKALVALLHSKDATLLERTLTSIGNCATFTANQDALREAGCLCRLQSLLLHQDPGVQLAATRSLGNLSLNVNNQRELKEVIPILLGSVVRKDRSPQLLLAVLTTLTNIAVLPDWHNEYYSVLHELYSFIDEVSPHVKLQSLKLLVNLSTNEDMVPSLLAAQAPRRLVYLLDPSTNEDILLRVVTLLANLTTTAQAQSLDPTIDLPAEDKAASPDTMYAAIYGVNIQERMQSKMQALMHKHSNSDIRSQAKRVYDALHS